MVGSLLENAYLYKLFREFFLSAEKTLFKYISSIFFSICLVLFFVVMILFARELRDVPDLTQAHLQDPLSSEIYDKTLN